jgi:2-methylisocitrate lyase-like PEP mutase family enzyme
MTGMQKQKDQEDAFRRLHSSGCLVMPNPWDAGSARALEQVGFQALATTSSGFAWTLGRADNQPTLDEVLNHLRAITGGVSVPVNADFEGGHAVDPQQVDANVTLAVATGIADSPARTQPATWPTRFVCGSAQRRCPLPAP